MNKDRCVTGDVKIRVPKNPGERNLTCGLSIPSLILLVYIELCFYFIFCRILYFINFTYFGLFYKIQSSFSDICSNNIFLVWQYSVAGKVLLVHPVIWYTYAEIPPSRIFLENQSFSEFK